MGLTAAESLGVGGRGGRVLARELFLCLFVERYFCFEMVSSFVTLC